MLSDGHSYRAANSSSTSSLHRKNGRATRKPTFPARATPSLTAIGRRRRSRSTRSAGSCRMPVGSYWLKSDFMRLQRASWEGSRIVRSSFGLHKRDICLIIFLCPYCLSCSHPWTSGLLFGPSSLSNIRLPLRCLYLYWKVQQLRIGLLLSQNASCFFHERCT